MLRKTRSVLAKAAALIAHRGGRGHCGGFGGSGYMRGFGGAPTEGRGSPSAGQNQKARRLMLVSIVRAVLVISASALVTAAEAQQPVVGTGVLVAPHISAPPPHISPSAPPHIAPVPSLAPHLIAPPTTGSPRPTYGSVPSSGVRSQGYIPEVSTTRHYHMLIPDQGRVSGHDFRSPNARTTNLGGPLTLRNPAFADLAPRTPAARWLARSTFRGKFADSDFGKKEELHHHHHHPVVVLGFAGPLFWPFAYDDLIDYTFRPYAYDTFWPRAYDDVFTGIYGGYAPEFYPDYNVSAGDETEICSGPAQRIIDFPIERIAHQVEPDQQQKVLLEKLQTATGQAVSILQGACPSEIPSTPPGRIAAMRTRVEAMLQAVRMVRPALEAFFQSLTDEQKERFNAIQQNTEATHRPGLAAGLCAGVRAQTADLPIEQMKLRLQLNTDQKSWLGEITEASAKAADVLKASCRAEDVLTPTTRLAAIEKRLEGLVEAIEAVQEPLERFYRSLDDEQKAHFNQLGIDPPDALREGVHLDPMGHSRETHSNFSICRC